MGLAVVNPLAKFKECNFIHSRIIEGDLKLVKGHVTQTTPLSGEIFHPWVNAVILDAFAKFEDRSL